MNPKKIWCNLAVTDLDRTTQFYSKLGFKPNGASSELTSFFVGENDFIIHFFLKEVLEANLKRTFIDGKQANEVIFTLAAESRSEADDWAKEVERAGGTIVSAPEAFGEGYYGFVFADPDGHLFNVFHM